MQTLEFFHTSAEVRAASGRFFIPYIKRPKSSFGRLLLTDQFFLMLQNRFARRAGRAVAILRARSLDGFRMRQHFLRLFLAEDLRAHVGRRKADQPVDGHDVFFQLGDKRLRLLLFVRRADGAEPRVGRGLRLLTAGMRRDQVLRLLDNLFVHVDSLAFLFRCSDRFRRFSPGAPGLLVLREGIHRVPGSHRRGGSLLLPSAH